MRYLRVKTGEDAFISAPGGTTMDDSVEWALRYGDSESVKLQAASMLASYEYLVYNCSKEELWRIVKLIRAAAAAN